jgi:AraC-like DNA-binding protein
MNRIFLISRAAFFSAFLWTAGNATQLDTSCLTLELPEQGAVITAPACTLSVRACGQVLSVHFRAQYALADRPADTTVFIGDVNNPPFKLVWNTENVPNVVYAGITILAEAWLKNGTRQTVSRQGIFIVNKSVNRPVSLIPFAKNGGMPLFSQSLSARKFPATVHASACWSSDALNFTIRVLTPIVFSSLTRTLQTETGIDLCLDPGLMRRPYPSDSTIVLTIPLEGLPFMTMYRAVWGRDGSFSIVTSKAPAPCIYDIRKEDTKGFAVSLSVSKEFLAGFIPDSFGCNIIVKIPGDNNLPARLSWNNASGVNAYSPVLWGVIRLMPRPFFQNRIVQFLMAFVAGLLLALGAGSVYFLLQKKSTTFEKFEQSEDEKKLSDKVYLFVEENITKKDISLHWVAQKLDLQAHSIERLIKKYKGKSFRNYIMFLRIEIAKERLRSSHASEKSIAESCGFRNVSEMEKYFSRFNRISPYKFRKENQVA